MRSATIGRHAALAALACAALLLAACTGTSGGGGEAFGSAPARATSTPTTGIVPGSEGQAKLELTPLIITSLESKVTPVKGSDGKYYVAYELSVFNDSPRDATMTRVDTLAKGKVIATLAPSRIAANTMLAGGPTTTPPTPATIPAGRTAIVVFRDTYPNPNAIPASFTHRISASLAPAAPGASRLAPLYPGHVVQVGGTLSVSTAKPVVIGPPLAGDDWVASNGLDPAALNAHSDVVIPVGGRVHSAETFGIDFVGVDPTTMQSYRGDPALNTSYLAFGKPLIAVADAKVVQVVSDQPDLTPMGPPEIATISDAAGNSVVLDLGHGVFALYAHMEHASATVKVGDTVKKGQVIGRLGNSGNTSEAHLHFQLQRGPLISADNVPWVIDRFTAAGQIAPGGESVTGQRGPRTDAIPVGGSVSDFPALK